MSFYVTLPSNSSLQYYPSNTLSRYITKLNPSIKLDGQYEVAITEIMFPYNWQYRQDASLLFSNGERNEKLTIRFYAFDTIYELFDNINEWLNKKAIPVNFYYNTITQKASLNIDFPWSVQFLDNIQHEFGFIYGKIQGSPDETTFHGRNKVLDHLNRVNSLYIYSDIADYQYIGDSFAPLLRVVAVDNNFRYGEFVNKIFNTPDYVPVIRNNIDSIEIDIRTDTGESVHFTSGKVLIKLHFRPKQNGL